MVLEVVCVSACVLACLQDHSGLDDQKKTDINQTLQMPSKIRQTCLNIP